MKQRDDKLIESLKERISGYEVPGAENGWESLSRRLDSEAAAAPAGAVSRGWKVKAGIAAAAAAALAAFVLLLPEKQEQSVNDVAVAADEPVVEAIEAPEYASVPSSTDANVAPAATDNAPVTAAPTSKEDIKPESVPAAAAEDAHPSAASADERAQEPAAEAGQVKSVSDKSFEELLAEAYPEEKSPESRKRGWNFTAGTSAIGAGAGEALTAARAMSRIEGIFVPQNFYSSAIAASDDFLSSAFADGITSTISGNPSSSALCNTVDLIQVKSGNLSSDFSSKAVTYTHRQPVRFSILLSREFGRRSAVESGLVYSILKSDYSDASAYSLPATRTLHYIGIPLNYRCDIVALPQFDAYMKVGAMAEKCIGGTNDIYRRPDTKTLYFSFNGAAGAEYLFSDRLGLFAEPGVSYYLHNDSYTISIYNDSPLSFSLNAGLRFRL